MFAGDAYCNGVAFHTVSNCMNHEFLSLRNQFDVFVLALSQTKTGFIALRPPFMDEPSRCVAAIILLRAHRQTRSARIPRQIQRIALLRVGARPTRDDFAFK